MELWPNFKFLAPSAVYELRDPGLHVQKREIKPLDGTQVCHFTGQLKGVPNSRVAVSTCDGLVWCVYSVVVLDLNVCYRQVTYSLMGGRIFWSHY